MPECPNFEVTNPIRPALTSRETTLMVSVLEVEVKLKLPSIFTVSNETKSRCQMHIQ